MATRRQFAFGSLVLALTGGRAARAGAPHVQKALAPEPVEPARVRWGHRAILRADIGDPLAGDPLVADRYHARAACLAASNTRQMVS